MSTENSPTIDDLQAWVGRQETQSDTASLGRMQQMAATFGWPDQALQVGAALPPLAHLFFCNELTPAEELGHDGHAKRGSFMPPVALPRRMWAGSDTRFDAPILIGDQIERRSTVKSVTQKVGRSGTLVFVILERAFTSSSGGALTETRTVVYREAPTAMAPETLGRAAEPFAAQVTRGYQPDEIMLFRFSALTWNGHRIHYDRSFCQQHEFYPDVVVHGPLMGFLAAQAAAELAPEPMTRFEFRSQQPCFVNRPIEVAASARSQDGAKVQVSNFAGEVALVGTAHW